MSELKIGDHVIITNPGSGGTMKGTVQKLLQRNETVISATGKGGTRSQVIRAYVSFSAGPGGWVDVANLKVAT